MLDLLVAVTPAKEESIGHIAQNRVMNLQNILECCNRIPLTFFISDVPGGFIDISSTY